MITMRILDENVADELVRERRKNGHDNSDEVWDGVYIVSPYASNPHQFLATRFVRILGIVIEDQGLGVVQAGANVSDVAGEDWTKNYRVPDVVAALNGGRAEDRGTHWFGGPDFLIEVQSPEDETDAKIPFYGRVGVRELLIVHRDTRRLRLFRHDGTDLLPVESDAKKWLASAVVPLDFRRTTTGRQARTEVRRTDGTPGRWTI
jgi:Uma2 family endonuclease